MKKSKFDFAVKLLEKNYETALSLKWVHKPMAYALYQTWKEFDINESDRSKKNESKTV